MKSTVHAQLMEKGVVKWPHIQHLQCNVDVEVLEREGGAKERERQLQLLYLHQRSP